MQQYPVDERLRPRHEPESDAGAENLGEAVEPQHAAVLVHGEEAGHPLLALFPGWGTGVVRSGAIAAGIDSI